MGLGGNTMTGTGRGTQEMFENLYVDGSVQQGSGQKVGLFGATPVVQASHIADPTGGATTDAEARAAIDAILVVLENLGLTASS